MGWSCFAYNSFFVKKPPESLSDHRISKKILGEDPQTPLGADVAPHVKYNFDPPPPLTFLDPPLHHCKSTGMLEDNKALSPAIYGRAQCADYNTARAEACHRQASAHAVKQAPLKAALTCNIQRKCHIEAKSVGPLLNIFVVVTLLCN